MKFFRVLEEAFEVAVYDEAHHEFGRECGCELFRLHYTITRDAFMIEDVVVSIQGEGCGRQLIETVWSYCQTKGIDLFANFVMEDAIGFWEKMGFVKDPADPHNYIRQYCEQAA